jgi:preprotein translocase subunit YajC
MINPTFELLMRPLWLIAQAEGAAAASAEGAEGQATGAPTTSLIEVILGNPLNLLLISGILFVLLVLRPQQKQMKDLQQRLASIKKNDRVVTGSGIHGTVVQANEGEPVVSIRIDDSTGARMTINRDAITKIVEEEKKESS